MKRKKKLNLYFFALAASGVGISGSDRIFIELARRWCKKHSLTIYTSYEGRRLCRAQKLTGKKLIIDSIENKAFEKLFFLNYFYKIFAGIRLGLSLKLENKSTAYLYNASEFWMDSLPCVLLKIRYPKVNWVATWYQTAPNPIKGFAEGARDKSYALSAFLYWFVQLPIKPLINMFADKVIVNNKDERRRYPKFTKRGDTIVLIGAVPLSDINKYRKKHPQTKKRFDAVFQGRFHPQKGVVELIEIWRKVVENKPKAKLAMIGDGPLMESVKFKIKSLKLEKNVILFGYVFDGAKKYRIFSGGKVVAHPAFYDSGGMASAEAMAFGLPCVGFNLKAYESYYPKGMVKVRIGDKDAFAKEILRLLEDRKLWLEVAKDAKEMIEANWSWEKRASQILEKISE